MTQAQHDTIRDLWEGCFQLTNAATIAGVELEEAEAVYAALDAIAET
ncbi:hypothetical protein [Kaistia terrae]|uniref:Uncharacterized protein n=1 Tax=Kaistia terrae TaxID=537017 RepID=A0ABW0Q4C6_9HYPH|nr:hypothetical protein [Kaistia terrae]MCX5581581.1 hypothetical protein [Kaistia terrae]